MGNKDKKKSRHRSRTRSRDRHKHKKSKKRSNKSSSESSPSPDRTKSRRRHRSRSRDSSVSSTASPHRNRSKRKHRSRSPERRREKKKLTVEEMEELQKESRKQKEMAKALETPEEKRARRLAKKEAKERKRKANMGWDDEYMGYTNVDNPFGDEHLLDHFVWHQKLEKEGMKHLPAVEIHQLQRNKMVENKIELEKVKKRRLEREKERAEREEEMEMVQRDKEADYFREWEKQEDSFHLNQAKLRSKIRIEDGRAKPIDLLAKYISMEDEDFSVEMHEPYTYLNGLTMGDLEDLMEDIKVYLEMEEGRNADFWRDITIVTEEELATLRKMDPESRDYIGDRRTGINHSVMDDVSSVFKGKTLQQLHLLQEQIRKKLTGGQEGVDIGYWETLLQQLKAHMARTRLRERHQEQLRRKLFKLKQEQGIESEPLFPIMRSDSPASVHSNASGSSHRRQTDSPAPVEVKVSQAPPIKVKTEAGQVAAAIAASTGAHGTGGLVTTEPSAGTSAHQDTSLGTSAEASPTHKDQEAEEGALVTEAELAELSHTDYDAGGYSPVLLRDRDLEPDTLVLRVEEDMKRLEYARRQLQRTGRAKSDIETEFEKKAREGMDREEAQFSVEVPLEQSHAWSDKYRPRKPRFFNRVHTGFEWNKYNQTHYDIDNPPPKIVQGYKFNIFYPDLIDKSKTPEYTLTPIEGSPDFSTLRFRAGPPYEDIAFKIVNREWEYSYKRGFRCQFHNNIFQLWFHFKRYRYRR